VFQTKVHLRSSITLSVMKSRTKKVVLQYISPQMSKISRHFGKASVKDERVCVLKLELVETTSSLKKEEMTPRLGGSTDVLLIYGQSFSVRKMVQDEQFLSSSESGFEISDGQTFFSSWSRLLMYHRQRLPIVVNMGSGLGQSLFLRVTQEDRPASPDNDFPLWLTWGMVRFGGWCRTIIP
jgi:hypothetical protein